MDLHISTISTAVKQMPSGLETQSPAGQGQEAQFKDSLHAHDPAEAGGAAGAGGPNGAKGPSAPGAPGAAREPDAVSNVRTTDAQKVNGGVAIPDKQDMFGHMEKVRSNFQGFIKDCAEFDKKVANGGVSQREIDQHRQYEMRTLLHYQLEMQGASMKVELASKVVENATSGVKTVLQTQA